MTIIRIALSLLVGIVFALILSGILNAFLWVVERVDPSLSLFVFLTLLISLVFYYGS